MTSVSAAIPQNRLEEMFYGLPGPVRTVFDPIFQPANDALHSVAGDPGDLIRAGQVYLMLEPKIRAVGTTIYQEATALGSSWEAESYDQFLARMSHVQQTLDALATSTGQTDEILRAAAEAAVDGANMIVDIILMALEFALTTLVINAALAAFTFGASMAAWVAENMASAALALSRVLRVVDEVGQVIFRISQILAKIAQVLRKIEQLLIELRLVLSLAKSASKATKLFSAAGAQNRAITIALYALTKEGINLLPGPNIPGKGGTGLDIGEDVGGLNEDVGNAQDVPAPPTY